MTGSLSDVVSLARRVGQIEVSPQFTDYSKVIIHVDDETVIEAGNDTGRSLEFTCPFATQAMADTILASLTGFQYQPYKVKDALLDPAAEVGDAANTRGSYGGIYQRERKFTPMMAADIAAPQDEEIDHEYAFETPEERSWKRQIDDVKASLIIANDRIDASVTQTGGDNSSFGWSLTSTGHKWYANGNEVMAVTASGLKVTGEVQATTGKIGGFNITASSLWNNLSSFGGSQTSGVYIGTNGIQLGQRFKVDTSGNVTATRLTVDTLYIGGSAVSASTLNSRANSAYNWTDNNGSYCTGGAYWGYKFDNATDRSPSYVPSYFTCGTLTATSGITTNGNVLASYGSGYFGSLKVGSYFAEWKSKTINGTTIFYLGR